jgi:general stress protein 26
MADADGITKLVELTKDIKITMFTTIDADGHFVSRPMAQQLTEPDGDLWFFAERDSRVVEQIAANPHIGLTLTDNSTWISIDGEAQVIQDRDKAKSLWNSFVEAWLPQGAGRPKRGVDQSRPAHCGVLGHPGRAGGLADQPGQVEGHRRALRRWRSRHRDAVTW